MNLLSCIENHMKERRMSPTRFGIAAVGDSKFVFNLWQGRQPREKTVKRVLAFIEDDRGEAGNG